MRPWTKLLPFIFVELYAKHNCQRYPNKYGGKGSVCVEPYKDVIVIFNEVPLDLIPHGLLLKDGEWKYENYENIFYSEDEAYEWEQLQIKKLENEYGVI